MTEREVKGYEEKKKKQIKLTTDVESMDACFHH